MWGVPPELWRKCDEAEAWDCESTAVPEKSVRRIYGNEDVDMRNMATTRALYIHGHERSEVAVWRR